MMNQRTRRLNELLKREIGEVLFQIMHERDLDLSAITVTHAVVSPNLRNARVFISIRDHEDERKPMLALIRKHRQEIQKRINKDLTLKYTPRLAFELDTSVEKGDHVLGLLDELSTGRDKVE